MASAIDNLKVNIQRAIESSSIYQSAYQWYYGLAAKDAQIVKLLGVAVGIGLIFLWIWMPAYSYKIDGEQRLQSEQKQHIYMKENAYKVSSSGTKVASTSGQSVLALINSTSKQKNIALNKFEPEGDDGIRIWLDNVKFDDVIDWIDSLENEHGVRVVQINIDKIDPGKVNLRAVLKR